MDNSKEYSIDVNAEELPITSDTSDKSPRESQNLKTDNTKNSFFAKIKSWYEPTYIKSLEAPANEKPKLRYCNGRLTKRKFIFFHFVIISLFFTIIFAPIAYFLIIPAFIRFKVQHVDLNDIAIDHMDVLEWKSNGLRFSWKATLPKQFFLPLKTKLAALDLTIHDANSNSLLVVGIPEMEVNLGEPIVLNFEGDVSFTETNGLKNFLGEISKPEGIKDTSVSADTQITVNMWGITWYKNLSVKRTIPVPKLSGNLLDLWNIMPKFLISKDMQSMTLNQQTSDTVINIGGVNATNVNKPVLIDGVSYWQILPGFPPINLQSFDIAFTNEGPNVSLKALMVNPTVVSIPLPDTSIGLQLENSYLATANVNGFNLTRGLNNLDLNLKLTFDPSRIVSPNQLSNSISQAAGKLLGTDQSNDQQLRFDVIGPVELKGVDFIGDVTEKLALTLPINEIIKNTNVMLLKNLFDVKGIESLLHTIQFDVKILEDRIIIPVNISLPSFLPLPPSLDFRYNTSLGIFKGEQNVLTVGLGGISMTNNETLNIETTATIFPNNTFEAASALASIVNPSLFGNISSADIKNFSILNETGGAFPWVNDLFGSLSLNILIPGFNTTTIINLLTQNGTSIPAEMLGMRLTQRSDVAGFNVNGTVAIKYPPFLPIITIGTGYVETTIYTDDVLLATAKLPNGLSYTAGENSTNIVASAILNKDDRLKSIISQLVMSVLETEDNVKMPIIGISGLKLGISEALNFVTFSQILVPVNLATLKPAMKTAIGTISQSIQKQVGLLSLTGVDFAIITSNSLSINIQTILNNPMNIIADIGSVSLTTTLFYGELANITISPIQLAVGRSPFNLQMRIDLVDGKDGMADNVLQLFNDLTSTEGDFRSIIGIKNFVIAPPAPITTQGGNANVTLATIDQFSAAQITIPSSLIPAENLRSINVIEMIKNPKNSIIDISGILPTSETTFTLPTIKGVSVETKENAQLLIGSVFSYVNPLPISAKIPYFGATVILDGNNFVTFGISQIDLERNQGNMDISLAMSFYNTDEAKSAVNEFFKNLLNGEIKQKIEISGIYFGGPNENTNDLLNLLRLPLPTDLVDINSIKNKVIELSPIKLPLSLDQLLSSQFMPQLKSVDVTTLPNRVLSLKIGAQLNVPFAVRANIGYVGVKGITLDDKQFTSVDITGIQTEGAGINFVTLGIQLAISDEDSIPKSIKSIYDSLINGNFISTKGGINEVTLGISADDSIRTFEKISLSTEIGNLITGQLNLNGIIDSILTNVGNSNNLITAGQGSISINIPNLAQIVIAQLGINFLPGKMIEAKIVSTITLSFTLTMNIGFASVGIFLDDLSAFEIRIASASQGQVVSIASSIKINDSDELADKLGGLAKNFFDNTPLTGNLAIREPYIGASNKDVIKAFSLISLELSLEKLVTPLIKNLPKSIDPITLIDQIGFKLNALGIETASQHKMLANVQASFNNNFPVTINIGFVELSMGLDLVNFVEASLSNLSIGSGANNGLSISSSLEFQPSNDQVQDKIASFANSLQQNGLGKTNELFSVSGIKIGPSPDDFIKSFEKIVVGIPSSLILNQIVVGKLLGMAGLSLNDLTVEGMLNRLNIGNIAVNMDPNGQELAIKGNVGISNISLPINVNMGILELSVALNASPLTRVILPDIKIVSSNNVISTDFTVALIFQDSDGLQDEVAALAKSLIEGNNGTVIPGNANINGLLFGSSNSDKDIINTFSKVLISIPLNPILQPIKAMITNIINGFIDGTGAVKLALDDVSVGIKNSNTLTADIAADLTGLPQISLNIPFASVDVSINGGLFVSTIINGMKFEGSKFTTSAELGFKDNKQLANQLAVIVSDLVFRRLTYAVSLPVGISNLIFGPSPQKTFGLTRKISVGMDVGKFINDFSDFNQKNNLITIENIQSQLTQQGVEATVVSPAIPNLPLNLNIPSLLAQVFFNGVSGGISKAAVKPNVKKGQSKWEFGLTVIIDNGPMSQALETAVPNLLAFKSYTDGASLGGVILCTSDNCLNPPDNSFKIFNEINFVPPPLFLFNPINVELTKILPTLTLNTLFTNTGPLHADIGNFVLSLQSSGTSIFEVTSSQPIAIQNNLENGGKNVIPVEAKLTLDPLQIPKLLLDLVDFEKDFAIVLQVNKNGDQIGWLNDLLKNLPQTVVKNLLPILQGLIKNISIGIDLNNNNNSTIPIGDGKTINGTVPIGDGKTPDGKVPDGKIPDGKVPDDGSPKIPQGEEPKQPAEEPKQPAEEPKKPAAKDPQQDQEPEEPKQGKTPDDGEEESIGGKIIDVITRPFRPKSNSLTTETNDNIENSKPIYSWTIKSPYN